VRKQRVLFLCTQNSARSQMAKGFLRHLAGDRFEVYSAGLEATDEVQAVARSRRGCPVEGTRRSGSRVDLELVAVNTDGKATAHKFPGSPTIRFVAGGHLPDLSPPEILV